MRKLIQIILLTIVLFVGAFAASFFTLGVALADEAPVEQPPAAAPADKAHGGHHDPSQHFNFLGSPGEHYGKDIYGGKFGDGVMTDHDGNVLLGPDGKPEAEEPMSAPFIFLVLNFVLLLAILAWKGKPVIEKLAADRHDQIKTALDEAAKLRKQAADKLGEYEAKLKLADDEITKLVEGIRVDAEADKKRILESAERQAAQMQRDAELRIAAEIEIARATLTQEVTAAAIGATEKLLRDQMTATDQQKVLGLFISGVQEQAAKEAR